MKLPMIHGLIKLGKLFFILFVGALLLIQGKDIISGIKADIRYHKELKRQAEKWAKEGISDVTRSGNTLQLDTIKIKKETK